jgi:hypothetical protein
MEKSLVEIVVLSVQGKLVDVHDYTRQHNGKSVQVKGYYRLKANCRSGKSRSSFN